MVSADQVPSYFRVLLKGGGEGLTSDMHGYSMTVYGDSSSVIIKDSKMEKKKSTFVP